MKRKFNIFDVLIIVVLIAVAAVGYKMLSKTSEETVESVSDVTFTVEITNCENDLKNQIQPGDDIYDSKKGGYYGKVVDVYSKPSTSTVANTEDGNYELIEYQNRENVYITIKGTPTSMTDANIQFASQKVKVGTMAYLKSKNYVGYGYVIDLDIAQ